MKKFMLCIMGSLIALFVVFWCCISYTVNYKKITCDTSVSPDGKYELFEGRVDGKIAFEKQGNGGFGYDPILMLPEYGKTSAEITMDEKNAISHRGKALRAMKKRLAEEIGE